MALFDTKLTILVELFISGAWTDITPYVYQRDRISITRGRQNEGQNVDAASCKLTLDNRDGRWCARNPTSPYYGLIGRNTLLRVTAPTLAGTSIRMVGEVASWPQTWDISGRDIYTQIEAAGILRRLGHGQQPILATFATYIKGSGSNHSWPGVTAEPLAAGAQPLQLNNCVGNVTFNTGVLADTAELGMNVATTNLTQDANGYPTAGFIQAEFGVAASAGTMGIAVNFRSESLGFLRVFIQDLFRQQVIEVQLRGDAVNNDARVVLRQLDGDGVSTLTNLGDSGPLDALTDGLMHNLMFTVTLGGASIAVSVYMDGVDILDVTQASASWTGCGWCKVAYTPQAAAPTDVALSYLTVWPATPTPSVVSAAALGHPGETAGRRIERLCSENNITFAGNGNLDTTQPMGRQPLDTLLNLLQECANTDLGILYETRSFLGLAYTTRQNLYNKTPQLTLSIAAHNLGAAPDVIDDDQNLANDITVTSRTGGTATAILTTGPLSTQPPPDGVNDYQQSASANPQNDAQLDDLAHWLLSIGTVNEARYPAIPVNMANSTIRGSSTMINAIVGTDVGEIITLTGMPAWLPPDDVKMIVQGHVENLDQYGWDLTFNCAPESPYEVGVYGTAGSGSMRYDAENSTLTALINNSVTSFTVTSAANTALWTIAGAEFPFDINIDGERMTVTAITGASSPQTFTVTRGVNGAAKGHHTGAAVHLWTIFRYAL